MIKTISKKDLKGLEFETIEEYFNYIVESEANGQFKQCEELVNKLSHEQFIDFLGYLNDHQIPLKSHFYKR